MRVSNPEMDVNMLCKCSQHFINVRGCGGGFGETCFSYREGEVEAMAERVGQKR